MQKGAYVVSDIAIIPPFTLPRKVKIQKLTERT
nr:MAG TPA: hypothetical protein [Caudoviricetes sp.]